MAVRPLKELLKDAEEFTRSLGLNKTASSQPAAVTDDVSNFAQALMDAESVNAKDEGFEKTAKALNRAEALLQIQTLQKLAAFRNRALKAGYTEAQVSEAVEKIAAKKVHENLKVLTAVDGVSMPGADKNSLEKKKVPAKEVGQAPKDKDLTTTLGYGL